MKRSSTQETTEPRAVIAAEGGVVSIVASDRDPYEALDDLMVVVEELCPEWPVREPFTGKEKFRL